MGLYVWKRCLGDGHVIDYVFIKVTVSRYNLQRNKIRSKFLLEIFFVRWSMCACFWMGTSIRCYLCVSYLKTETPSILPQTMTACVLLLRITIGRALYCHYPERRSADNDKLLDCSFVRQIWVLKARKA